MNHRLWKVTALFFICIGVLVATLPGSVKALPRLSIAFTVTKVADTNDGACDADCSLREAIVAANAAPGADIIVLPAGVYTLSRAGGLEDAAATGDLDITDPLTIIGLSTDSTVIDANSLDRVFDIKSIGVVLAHITLQQGDTHVTDPFNPADGGGGIRLTAGALTLQDTHVISSTAYNGAGIANYGGTLVLTHSVVQANTIGILTGSGGGIYNTGTFTLTNSLIDANSISRFNQGGGIYTTGKGAVIGSTISNSYYGITNVGTLLVKGSTLSHTIGFALSNSGTAQVQASTVTGSVPSLGGGCAIGNGGTMTITVSTISGSYGAVCNNAHILVADSTIADNFGPSAVSNMPGAGGTLVLKNTILANPLTPNCEGSITSAGFNLDSGATCGLAGPGDRSNTDALLGSFQNNGGPTFTYALRIGSPAIDASSSCEPNDQRGVPRPQWRACDIGAYEYNAGLYRMFLTNIRRS